MLEWIPGVSAGDPSRSCIAGPPKLQAFFRRALGLR